MLLRLFVSQRGRVPSVAAEFELSPMQAHVLRLLEPDQPLPMRALAGKLCCDPSNVTGIVDRLEERGLVQRAVLAGRPADARAGRHRGRRPAPRPHAGAAGSAPGADRTALRVRPADAARHPQPGDGRMSDPNTRRIVRLFTPYNWALSSLLGMIVVAAGLAMIPAFLLRDLLDNVLSQGRPARHDAALPAGRRDGGHPDRHRRDRRRPDVAVEPDRPAGDARPARGRSTRTCSGCRWRSSRARAPARCSRGSPTTSAACRRVVTTTATSIVSNVTTVIATTVAMAILDWRLTLAAFALLPLFVLDDPAGRPRAARDREHQAGLAGRHLDAGRGVAVGVGRAARQDDGPVRRADDAVHATSRSGSPTSSCSSGWPAAG